MILQNKPKGLFFDQSHIDTVKNAAPKSRVVQSALQWLKAPSGALIREEKPKRGQVIKVYKAELTPLETTLAQAYTALFLDDTSAQMQAIQFLQAYSPTATSLQAQYEEFVTLAQLSLMLEADLPRQWQADLLTYAHTLLEQRPQGYVEGLWRMLLEVLLAILTQDAALFQQGISTFQTTIAKDIHPDGYFRALAQVDHAESFLQMSQATCALALTAEAATLAGANLWQYDVRDIAVNTAASYISFYYFYPEKWKWYSQLSREETEAVFSRYGACLEMAAQRGTVMGADIYFEQHRPLFSALGGLTSLTHSAAMPASKNWLRFFSRG